MALKKILPICSARNISLFGVALFGASTLVGCTGLRNNLFAGNFFSGGEKYLESGTIILSHQVPNKDKSVAALAQPPLSVEEGQSPTARVMAPLVGYFPPAVTYLPADNETWLEINRDSKTLVLFK